VGPHFRGDDEAKSKMHCSAERNSSETSVGLTAEESPIVAGDTIAAISTPAGEGAIALVRVSGSGAIAVADKVFPAKKTVAFCIAHAAFRRNFRCNGPVDRSSDVVDPSAPASYTGEDLVEISCHGGMLVSAHVLEACLRAGARAARPGEFTERAFLNGKMDLIQAEAVIDLIRAKTDLALRSPPSSSKAGSARKSAKFATS